MSATGQAATGGDAGQQGGDGGQGQGLGFDAQALQAQLQETRGGVDELRQQFGQFLESKPWAPAEPEANPADELDLSFLDQGYADPAFGDAERQQMQQGLAEAIRTQAAQQAQQMLAPVQSDLQQLRREQSVRDLVGEFPEFQDPEYAQKIAGPNGLAVQFANDIGRPDLAVDPKFWRVVHMANRSAEAANAEQDAGQGPAAARLEGAGGAGPGGGQQADPVGQILDGGGRRGGSVLPF